MIVTSDADVTAAAIQQFARVTRTISAGLPNQTSAQASPGRINRDRARGGEDRDDGAQEGGTNTIRCIRQHAQQLPVRLVPV